MPEATFRCMVKLRYRQPDHGVTVHLRENNTCKVVFDESERAVTPGQSAVLYNGDVCIGAGTIERKKIMEKDNGKKRYPTIV